MDRVPLLDGDKVKNKNSGFFRRIDPRGPVAVALWVFLCIIGAISVTVTTKKFGNALPDFPYFVLWFTSSFFVMFYFFFLYALKFFTDEITPKTTNFPHYKQAIIGSLIALTGVFMLFSNAHVSGIMQVLLGPSVTTIPLSMMVSIFMLRTRYNWKQVVSVLIIIGGLVIALWPSISGSSGSGDGSLFWDLMWALASVPLVFSTVYQEKAFAEGPVHIAYILAWSTLYQFLTILLMAPLSVIPGFGNSSMQDFLRHEMSGLLCFLGKSIPASECPMGCDCAEAWKYVMMFMLAYIFMSFAIMCLVKYGSATFAFIASTIATPLSAFAFSFAWIMGTDAEQLSMFNYIALVVILVGTIGYRFFDKSAVKAHELQDIPDDREKDEAPFADDDARGDDDGECASTQRSSA